MSGGIKKLYGRTGHGWSGPFKVFPIQEDEHLVSVLRDVEREALRAGLRAGASVHPCPGRVVAKVVRQGRKV